MDKRAALQALERAFRDYFWATDATMPDIGILVIGLSYTGCDLQYIGITPNVVIDWPTLFAGIIQEIERGNYRINHQAEITFER